VKARKSQSDAAAVTERAKSIHAEGMTGYWIIVTMGDGVELAEGRVPEAVKAQCVANLHPFKAEGRQEYLLRLAEADEVTV
jgi:hypothetical protein